MVRENYEAQVALLVRVLPHVAKERTLALKGGTAINLFYRDLPRLSVDIDLTYLPAVRWKLIDLRKLKCENPAKHAKHRSALEALFG